MSQAKGLLAGACAGRGDAGSGGVVAVNRGLGPICRRHGAALCRTWPRTRARQAHEISIGGDALDYHPRAVLQVDVTKFLGLFGILGILARCPDVGLAGSDFDRPVREYLLKMLLKLTLLHLELERSSWRYHRRRGAVEGLSTNRSPMSLP